MDGYLHCTVLLLYYFPNKQITLEEAVIWKEFLTGAVLYKTKSLDGTKPNTNPKTNPNTNLIQLFYAFFEHRPIKLVLYQLIVVLKVTYKLAKDTARKIASGEIAAPVNVSAKSAFSICSEITRKSWQRSWDNEPAGRSTHELIPTVYTKILFPVE